MIHFRMLVNHRFLRCEQFFVSPKNRYFDFEVFFLTREQLSCMIHGRGGGELGCFMMHCSSETERIQFVTLN